VRSYDLAITKDGGDYTVGLLLCAHEKRIIVLDMWRVREGPDAVEQGIKGNAIRDGVRTIIDLPKDPGQAGKYQVNALTAALRGYQVVSSPEEKSKIVRANVAAVQVNQGLVSVVRAGWNDAFLAELRDFTEGARHDDIVDALSRGVVNLGDLGLTHEERLELLERRKTPLQWEAMGAALGSGYGSPEHSAALGALREVTEQIDPAGTQAKREQERATALAQADGMMYGRGRMHAMPWDLERLGPIPDGYVGRIAANDQGVTCFRIFNAANEPESALGQEYAAQAEQRAEDARAEAANRAAWEQRAAEHLAREDQRGARLLQQCGEAFALAERDGFRIELQDVHNVRLVPARMPPPQVNPRTVAAMTQHRVAIAEYLRWAAGERNPPPAYVPLIVEYVGPDDGPTLGARRRAAWDVPSPEDGSAAIRRNLGIPKPKPPAPSVVPFVFTRP